MARKKISARENAGTLTGDEIIPVVRLNVADPNLITTAQDIADLASAAGGIQTGEIPNGTLVTLENTGDGRMDFRYGNDSLALTINTDAGTVALTGYDNDPQNPTANYLKVGIANTQAIFPANGSFYAGLDIQNSLFVTNDGGVYFGLQIGGSPVFFVNTNGSFQSSSDALIQGGAQIGGDVTIAGTISALTNISPQTDNFDANGPSRTHYTDEGSGGLIIAQLPDATIGTRYRFTVMDNAMEVRGTNNGQIVKWWDGANTQNTQWVLMSTPGMTMEIEKIATSTWQVIDYSGIINND